MWYIFKSPGYESIKNNDPWCQIQCLNFKFWGWLGPRLLVHWGFLTSQDQFLKFTISRGLTVYIYHTGVLFQFVYGVQSQLVTELQGRWHCEETEYYCDFILAAAGIIDLTCAASACCANLLLQVPCLGTENIARTSLPKSETLQSSKWGHRPDEVKLPGNIWTPPASWI